MSEKKHGAETRGVHLNISGNVEFHQQPALNHAVFTYYAILNLKQSFKFYEYMFAHEEETFNVIENGKKWAYRFNEIV